MHACIKENGDCSACEPAVQMLVTHCGGTAELCWLVLLAVLQEVGCGYVDWIGLAQDRDRWRTLVSLVMNLRVP